MRIYYFDEHTGAYLGTDIADANQLEPGDWILPPNCTLVEPPAKNYLWLGGVWREPAPAPVPMAVQPRHTPTLPPQGSEPEPGKVLVPPEKESAPKRKKRR